MKNTSRWATKVAGLTLAEWLLVYGAVLFIAITFWMVDRRASHTVPFATEADYYNEIGKAR